MQPPISPFQQALLEVEVARKKAEDLRQQEFEAVVADMKFKISLYGVTAKDLGFDEAVVTGKESRSAVENNRKDLRSNVRPKYRSPVTGDEWSGRGKAPGWVTKHIMAGGVVEDLLISKNNTGEKNE